MKKLVLILALLLAVNSFGVVLKKVNLPENWKIESSEEQKDFTVNEIKIPKYTKQVLSTPNGALTVHYYICGSEELFTKVFNSFFSKKQVAFKGTDKTIYMIEGDAGDIKNALRFVELPMTEQIKVIFPDIAQIQGSDLTSEEPLTVAEVKDAGNRIGIQIKSGIKQVYTFANSKAKLLVKYYFCKDKNEARVGYSNARIRNKNDLISYIFAEDFLAELEWVK